MTSRPPAARGFRLAHRLIALAAPLVPSGLRDDWRHEWEAELAALEASPSRAGRGPVRRALGAWSDAFWIRQRHVADFDWIDDLRHGARQLTGNAGFAVTTIGILALGLAATVTMFSVMDQVLLRPLPYPEPERIVTLWETRSTEPGQLDPAPANFLDWRERSRSFEYLAGAEPWSVDHTDGTRPEVLFAVRVTEGFFESFGVTPLHGRFFQPGDFAKGSAPVIVLHEPVWRQRFGGDPAIVGQAVLLDNEPVTVVGIAPASFEPRLLPTAVQRTAWLPKAIEEYETRIRTSGYWNVVGRLKPGVTLAQAQAEMHAIARQLETEYDRTNKGADVQVVPLRDHFVGDVESAMVLLGGAVGLVLLIACVNLANLLLARGAARERELAVRVALGARKGRIVRQLLLESLVLAAAGGVAGVLLAQWGLTALARLGPASVPWLDTVHLDVRAVLFAGGLSVGVALVAGLLPALRSARAGLAAAGRQTSTADPTQHRTRAALVVAEVALALVLVAGAGLLIRSFVALMSVDTGFSRDQVLALQVFAWDQNRTPEARRIFFDETMRRMAALPAVQHVGAVSAMPFIESNINIEGIVTIAGRPQAAPGEEPRGYLSVASPGYFDAMRVPLIAGRHLADRDGANQPQVAVISEAMAARFWPAGDDPIGDRLSFRFSGRPVDAEIVGVVGSLRHDSLDRPARPEVFFPLAQHPFGSMTFVLRTAGDPVGIIEPAKAAIWQVSPLQAIYRTATLDELVTQTVSGRRFAVAVLLAFALVALLLAAAGVYGVLAATTAARLREMGVRVALGASWWDIVRNVLGRGALIAGIGMVIGLAGALGVGRLAQSFLYDVAPADPITLAAACTVMALAALAACWMPARRAAAADPVEVLRAE